MRDQGEHIDKNHFLLRRDRQRAIPAASCSCRGIILLLLEGSPRPGRPIEEGGELPYFFPGRQSHWDENRISSWANSKKISVIGGEFLEGVGPRCAAGPHARAGVVTKGFEIGNGLLLRRVPKNFPVQINCQFGGAMQIIRRENPAPATRRDRKWSHIPSTRF